MEEFEHLHTTCINKFVNHLKDTWIVGVRFGITKQLANSEFHLQEPSFDAYQRTELKRLLSLVKFYMQDTLRFIAQDCIHHFCAIMEDACSVSVNVCSLSDVQVTPPPILKTKL